MKNWRSVIVKSCMLFAAVFLIGAAVPASAKAAPKLSAKKITLKVGQKKKLKVKNVKKKKIKWSSKKKAVATVNKKGVVKAKKKGKTTIIAKAGKKKLKCKVVVKKADNKKKDSGKNNKKKDDSKISKTIKKQLFSDKVYVSFSAPEKMALGKSVDLFKCLYVAGKEIATPSDTVKTGCYKWFSSDSSVISVNKYSVATAYKTGKAKVYFKRMDKQGNWISSKTHTIEVINAGDVSFSFAYGLNRDLVNLSERYYEYNFNKMNQPGAFNYIKVTITNNSATMITMSKELAFYDTRWWYWNTQDKKDVVIPAKATISIIYSANSGSGVWNTNDIEQVSSPYTINGEKVYPVYDVDEQVWEYQ